VSWRTGGHEKIGGGEKRSYSQRRLFLLFLFILLLFGCGGGQHWYNPGKTRVDFDSDSQECEILARELSRQATLTGRREDPQTYGRAFNACLYGKGWSTLPPVQPGAGSGSGEADSSLAVYHPDGRIEVFGRYLAVPAGFVLQSNGVQRLGPTLSENLFFMGPDSVFMNISVQKSLDSKFEPANYPAQPPFFLYEQGRDEKQPDLLRWAVFAGKIHEEWVAGLGGYLLLGERERLTVVITGSLPDPHEPVPPALQLSHGQFQAVERFREEWLSWLQAQI
jgi:hypothetical protein